MPRKEKVVREASVSITDNAGFVVEWWGAEENHTYVCATMNEVARVLTLVLGKRST